MCIKPEKAIKDAKNYLKNEGYTLNVLAEKILLDWESFCYKNDIYIFGEELFFSLLKYIPSFKNIFHKYGGISDNLEEKYLEMEKQRTRDTYQDSTILYSSEESRSSSIRP